MSVLELRPVCIVEDDYAVRASLRLLLELEGYVVMAFPTAEVFLEATDGRQACCLLLDLNLPGMSGIELVESLRRDGVNTPVILLTAKNLQIDARCRQAGIFAILQKPADLPDLLETVQKACTAPPRD